MIGELELAWRWVRGPVIAITGHEGEVDDHDADRPDAAAAGRDVLVGGNIGVPLSAQVDDSTPETVHVVEASSFQLETTTTFRPWIALWLNFAADHLDRHPDHRGVRRRQGADLRESDGRRLGRRQRGRPGGDGEERRHARAQRVSFSPSGPLDEGFVADGDWIVRRTRDRRRATGSGVGGGADRAPHAAQRDCGGGGRHDRRR